MSQHLERITHVWVVAVPFHHTAVEAMFENDTDHLEAPQLRQLSLFLEMTGLMPTMICNTILYCHYYRLFLSSSCCHH